jgi:hypothetical protein
MSEDMEIQFDGPFVVPGGGTANPAAESAPVDRTRIEAVEKAFEDRLIVLLAEFDDVVDGEAKVDQSRTVGILFGCWRSLQPELDRAGYESPFAPLMQAVAEKRRNADVDPGEGEEEADGDEAG